MYRLPFRRWRREQEQCLAEIDALLGASGAAGSKRACGLPRRPAAVVCLPPWYACGRTLGFFRDRGPT